MVDIEVAMFVVVEIFLLFFLLIFGFCFASEVFVYCLFLGLCVGYFFILWFKNLYEKFASLVCFWLLSEISWTTLSPVKEYNCVSSRRAYSFG